MRCIVYYYRKNHKIVKSLLVHLSTTRTKGVLLSRQRIPLTPHWDSGWGSVTGATTCRFCHQYSTCTRMQGLIVLYNMIFTLSPTCIGTHTYKIRCGPCSRVSLGYLWIATQPNQVYEEMSFAIHDDAIVFQFVSSFRFGFWFAPNLY